MTLIRYLIICILLSNLLSWSHADIFSATFKIEQLLETRQKVITDLETFILNEENKLGDLKKYLEFYKAEQKVAMKDKMNYVGNPITAFTLVKRLTSDLDDIEKQINNRTVPEFISERKVMNDPKNKTVIYPTNADLLGAGAALRRLQKTYKLKVQDLANGVLNGVVYSDNRNTSFSHPMTASDCYMLGIDSYKLKDYKNHLAWHMAALRKFKLEDGLFNSVDEFILFEYIALAHYYLSDPESATEWTIKAINLNPEHKRARSNFMIYNKGGKPTPSRGLDLKPKKQDAVAKNQIVGETNLTGHKTGNASGDIKIYQDKFVLYRWSRLMFEGLCRGEYNLAPDISSRLTCRYLNDKPFLKLAPIKVEQYYIDPDVYLFHGVISDEEIEHVKNLSKPNFTRSEVVKSKSQNVVADYRVSQSSWLEDESSEVIARLTHRVADCTGLSLDYAEDFQVSNYGAGGFYDSHFDYFGKSEEQLEESDRVATTMFYLSDVAQGGATVFPRLGLSVFPVKGSAVFWMNLHPSGEGNQNTMHAACPVLEGSKWVANKWILFMGQEFVRPCTLEYQQEEVIRWTPEPVLKPGICRDEPLLHH